ncbi:hypothetical protein NMG60_11029385 [Bertholletia excelsa]
MEERETQASTQTKSKQSVICEECKSNPSKYKCPGCSIRSCSLPCVTAHKQRTGCTGKRQQTQFVPLSQFDDNLLLSDYNMLEDVKRVAESAQRMRLKLCRYPHFKLPFPLKNLRNAAGSRRAKLLFLSSGMSKREMNRSYYNQRKKFISWTIEWRFHSTDVVLIDHGIHENTNLCSVIENHLKPGPWKHKLRQFCDEPLESLKFFIRKYPKGPKSPFRQLDIKASLKEQLANLVILEYPVIHVFLPSHSYNFEVMKDDLRGKKVKDSISNNLPSPTGVTFREEEIEDDTSSDPQILDLAKHSECELNYRIGKPSLDTAASQGTNLVLKDDVSAHISQDNTKSSLKTEVPEVADESMNFDFVQSLDRAASQGTKSVLKDDVSVHKSQDNMQSSLKTEVPEVTGEVMNFDFEQGLLDAYYDLFGQGNPNDSFNLEDVFMEEAEVEEQIGDPILRGVIPEEDLEEGEIPGY